MTLSDRPPFILYWEIGLPGELLQAIGKLAVISAHIEEYIHQIYWRHAGLSTKNGPIVTEFISTKRLMEDTLKFLANNPNRAHILEDLEILFREAENINTKRNQCVHWIWMILATEKPDTVTINQPQSGPVNYRASRPVYKGRKGALHTDLKPADIEAIYNDAQWLKTRLAAHTISEKTLRRRRAALDREGVTGGRSFADLFLPAPWLDKPPQPKPKPIAPRRTTKARQSRRGSSQG
ncbi:MAG: hypothetical protein E6G81_02680 [Alphaproteobacteria bacterium]|nr:MAG: hypothetical protein E6G81_02680 [Alphaproteobacteria bacterium]